MGWYGDVGPVRLSYNSYFSTCFFSRNSVFLSQQISEQYFQPWLFSEANGLVSVHVSMHRCSTTLSPSLFTGFIGVDSWIVWQLSGIGEDGGSAWATQIEALVGLVGWPRLAFFYLQRWTWSTASRNIHIHKHWFRVGGLPASANVFCPPLLTIIILLVVCSSVSGVRTNIHLRS
jgi:hypothetical protein